MRVTPPTIRQDRDVRRQAHYRECQAAVSEKVRGHVAEPTSPSLGATTRMGGQKGCSEVFDASLTHSSGQLIVSLLQLKCFFCQANPGIVRCQEPYRRLRIGEPQANGVFGHVARIDTHNSSFWKTNSEPAFTPGPESLLQLLANCQCSAAALPPNPSHDHPPRVLL